MTAAFATAISVEEAVSAMAEGARPVAGGTDLVVGARQGKTPLPESIVAIHRVVELLGISQVDGTLRLGALVTHEEIAAHPVVRERLTALADASAIVGSHATRAQGTIGGNVMNASPAMETGGPLVCLDATVTLHGSGGVRWIAVADLFSGPGQTTAHPDELLTAVDVPLPADGTGSCYVRLEYRRQMEIAVVGATALVTLSDGVVSDAKVAITALAPTIHRIADAEVALVGSSGDATAIDAAGQAAADGSAPISDVRASETYRRAMAKVVATRAIGGALARAQGVSIPVPASASLYGGIR